MGLGVFAPAATASGRRNAQTKVDIGFVDRRVPEKKFEAF
jgi:hypothetical protein